MKYNTTLVCCFCLLLSATTFSQEKKVSILKTVETMRFKNDPSLGGDVIIQASTKEVIGDCSYITFEMEVPQTGNYVLNAWILPSQKPDSSFTAYDVQLNGADIAAKLQAKTSGWQTLALPGMLRLEAGKNTVSIHTKVPEIPNVEFIRLSTSSRKATISSAKYDDFAQQVASGSLQSRNSIQPAAAQYPNTPYAYYTGVEKVDLYYTFYVDFFFYEGQEIYLQTSARNNHAHILEIHNIDFPEPHTWHAKSNSQGAAWLRTRAPITGTYLIRVRSANQGTSGLVDISVNDWVTFENFTVTNMAYFREYRGWEGTYNTFTANSTTNPCLWIEDAFSGNTIASNLDYRGYPYTSDFDWGTEARVKYNSFGAVAINAQNAYEPVGTCDLYLGCPSGGLYGWFFENLKEDDDMISAPSTRDYNCISWSGGIADDWEWPLDTASVYFVEGDSLACFDAFYLAERYDGCARYTREGVTPENAVIDLWGFKLSPTYIGYMHASIRRNSDKNMHGYDWESKAGSFGRLFHPRNSIRGEEYGEIMHSYRLVNSGAVTNYSLEASIADGRSVRENVIFNSAEKAIITAEINKLTSSEKSRFTQLYNAWKETWLEEIFSNPDQYRNMQYEALLKYCRFVHRSLYLVFEKLGEGDTFNTLLVKDLTFTGSETNKAILNRVKADNKLKKTVSGAIVVRSPYSNWMKYVKCLLSSKQLSQTKLSNTADSQYEIDDICYSNMDEFTVKTSGAELIIDFVLDEATKVKVDLISLERNLITPVLKEQILNKGPYQNSVHVQPGIYLVKYVMNRNVNVKKIIVK